jgi:hypothetical protein
MFSEKLAPSSSQIINEAKTAKKLTRNRLHSELLAG